MRNILKIISFAFFVINLSLLNIQEVKASHAMGADIGYQCVGQDSFLVTLNFYRFCDGINEPTNPSVDITSPSGCGSTQSLTLTRLDSIVVDGDTIPNGEDITPLCENLASTSNCADPPGAFPGVEQYSYTGLLVLNSSCPDWTISYGLCCRNPDPTNLQSPSSADIYVESTLNNVIGCNNTPIFTSDPAPYICEGRLFNYNQGAVDIDGDSLVFTSINPLDNGQPIPYTGSFSPSNPLNTSTPFNIDPSTGQISFTPTGNQIIVLAVLVEEYRNGVLIGSTIRDIQVSINSDYCSDIPINNTGVDTSNVDGGVVTAPNRVEVCPGDSLSFEFYVVDTTTGQTNDLVLTTNAGVSIPAANVTIDTSALGDTLFGTFTWVPTGLDTGNNVLVIESGDRSQCPIEAIEINSINIFVLAGTFAGPDLTYCPAGGPLQLNVVGGNSFTWAPADGLSDSTIRNPLASPSQTTTYIVTSDLSSNCKNTDTITVFRVPDFVLDVLPSNDTVDVCRNGARQLEVQTDSTWAPFTYSWTPVTAVDDPNISNPNALVDTTTNLFLTVTSDTGCTIRDTITLNVVGTGPKANIIPDKEVICPGDTINLDLELFPLSCGPAVTGCGGTRQPVPISVGTDTTAYFATPFRGSSEAARTQILYRASDLIAAGMQSGTIFRIALDAKVIQSGGGFGGTYENLTIKMGCTEEDNLNSVDWLPVNTTVFGPQDYSISQGINNFNLFQYQQYDWDGQSNIVIEFCYTNAPGNAAGGDDELVTTSVGYTAMARNYDNGVPNGCALPNNFSYSERPNIIFTICDPEPPNYTYTWTPASEVSNPSIRNPFTVINDTVDFQVTVEDTLCFGTASLELSPQGNYGIDILPGDTFICNPGDSIQLSLQPTGNPPVSNLVCGANGTPCNNRPSNSYTVGTGTNTSTQITPFRGTWEDGRGQYLFRASELQSLGVTSGTITSMGWFVTSKNSTAPYQGFTIKMTCTNLNQLPSTSYVNTSFSTVYGPTSINTTAGFNSFTLDNSFDWDGITNIIVEVCFNNLDWTSNDEVSVSTTPFTSSLYDFTDGASGCTLSSPSDFNERPNIRFDICSAPSGQSSVQWLPSVNISNDTIENPIVFPTTTTQYVVDYTFAAGCPVSDTVNIGVTTFTADIPQDTLICAGDSATLAITGGNAFVWTPDSTLTCGDCANPKAFPDTTTTYNVFITDTSTGCSLDTSITVFVNPLPDFSISSDSIVCFVDSITLNAGAGFNSYVWNDLSTDSFLVANTAGTYSVTVSDSAGCSSVDSVTLKEGNPPVFSLPNDTAICGIDSFILNGPVGDLNYFWNTSSNDTSITVFSSGNYSLTVVDTAGCSFNDSINLLLDESVALNIGSDTTICNGDEITLSANVTPTDYTFLWSDSTTNPTLTVSDSGSYSLTVTDTAGCTSSDTILVDVNDAPVVTLGPDTTICAGESLILRGGPGTSITDDFNWSTGATSPEISVNSSDTYSLTVTDQFGCFGVDSIEVTVDDPQISITGNTSICDGEPAILIATAGFDTYFWLPTEESTDSIIVTDPGQYSVTGTTVNGCQAQASVTVNLNTVVPLELGSDIEICANDSVQIGDSDLSYVSYNWSPNGDTTAFITVNTPDVYTVTATDDNGCTTSDTIAVEYFAENELFIEDIDACSEFTITVDGGEEYASYAWSTGDSTQQIVISEHGNYALTVVDTFGCVYADSFSVNELAFEITASANPNVIQPDETAILNVTGNGSGDYGYVWTADPEDESLVTPNAAAPEVGPEALQTIYAVVVTDSVTGCVATDTTLLLANSTFALPNAFAPTGNSAENQYFDVIGNATVKTFQIFNRWGEMVYNNDNPLLGWDGTYNGELQPVGTYIYYVVILDANGEELPPITGNVSLIR